LLLESDARTARGARPVVMAQLRHGAGVQDIVDFLIDQGGLQPCAA
jgi:urease accessory protein